MKDMEQAGGLEYEIELLKKRIEILELENRKLKKEDNSTSKELDKEWHINLLETMFEGVALNELVFDENGEIVDYRILETNSAFSSQSKLFIGDVKGRMATEVYKMTSVEISEFWSENINTKKPVITDYYHSETNQWTRLSISPVKDNKFTTVFFDITEIRKSEEILKKKDAEYQTIIDTTFDGFWVVDLSGKILEVNNSYLRISGYTKEEVLSMHVSDIDSFEDKNDSEIRIQKIINREHDIFETQHRKKDGSSWLVEINVTFLDVDNGRIFFFLRDITERKKAELSVLESEEKFRTLIQSSQDAILINEDNFISFANNAALLLFGADSMEDIVGQSIYNLFHPDYHEVIGSRIKSVNQTAQKVPEIDEKIIRKDGNIIDVESTASPFWYKGKRAIFVLIRDITERKIAEKEKEITIQLLSLVSEKSEIKDLISAAIGIFREFTDIEAVGIRYREGSDFPYFETSGFPANFVEKEKYLCQRHADGTIVVNHKGMPVLECMCGNVLSSRFNPDLPFFTANGSFWTNSTTELLSSTAIEELQSGTRNGCFGEGYESVALIPLKFGKQIFGLLQLNDSRKGVFDLNKILFFERLAAYLSGAISHFESQIVLKNNENRYRRISSLISNVAYSCEKYDGFRFDWLAGSVEKTFGYSIAEMYEQGCWKFLVHENDRNLFDKNVVFLKPGEKSSVELRIISRDGQERWINSIAECVSENGKEKLYGGLIDITESKKSSEDLRLSTEALEEAQRIAKIGNWEYCISSDTFTFSGETSRIFGKDPLVREYTWISFSSSIDEKDWEEFTKKVQECINTKGSFSQEFRISSNEGQLTWALALGKTYTGPDGAVDGLRGTVQDITEQKRAEQALNHSHDLMRYVIEHNRGAVAIHDRNMNYVYVSQRYIQEYGVQDHNIIGKSHYEIFPDLPQKWKDAHKEALKGKIISAENDLFIKDDGTCEWAQWECRPWYEADGSIGGIIVYTEVITERKNNENAIKRSESQLNALFDSAPVIMILVNPNHEVIRMNRFGLESTSKDSCEIVNLRSGDVLKCIISYKDPRGCGFNEQCVSCKLKSIIGSTFLTGKEHFKVEAEILLYGERGIKKHTMLVSTSIISKEPEKNVLVTIDDITIRKEMEVALTRAKEKAEENDNLKSAFLANISHEIRTPMNGIIGFSEMIQKAGLSDDKRKYFSELIMESCKQLLNIINDVIDISRIDTSQISLDIAEMNLNELMLDIFMVNRIAAESKNISLYQKKGLMDEDAMIMTDKGKLKHILLNLVGNAVKFTLNGFIEYGYMVRENKIQFFVKDTGIGIKPALHNAVFERFRQAETSDTRTYGGAGLGLSISKGLVELMGGEIWLESEYGKGSEFIFNIPYIPSGDALIPGEDHIIGSHPENEVLIAEDDDLNYIFLEELLHSYNVKSYHAKNGFEAIQQFQSHSGVRLIFMDLKMPVKDGFEAAREIKKLAPSIPIIAQTAFFSSDIDEMKNFDGFIAKPILRDELKRLLEKYLKITRD